MVAFLLLALHSPSAIRHAFYETFLHLHILFVAAALGFLCVHLKSKAARKYLYAAIALWVAEVSWTVMLTSVSHMSPKCSSR